MTRYIPGKGTYSIRLDCNFGRDPRQRRQLPPSPIPIYTFAFDGFIDSPTIDLPGDFTIELFVAYDSAVNNQSGGNLFIIEGERKLEAYSFYPDRGNMYFGDNLDQTHYQFNVPFSTTIKWHHLAYSGNGTTIRRYWNGKLHATVPFSKFGISQMIIGGTFTRTYGGQNTYLTNLRISNTQLYTEKYITIPTVPLRNNPSTIFLLGDPNLPFVEFVNEIPMNNGGTTVTRLEQIVPEPGIQPILRGVFTSFGNLNSPGFISASLNIAGPITIEYFIRQTATSKGTVLTYGRAGLGSSALSYLDINGRNIDAPSGSGTYTIPVNKLDTWAHIAYSGTIIGFPEGQLNIYYNGTRVDSGVFTGTALTYIMIGNYLDTYSPLENTRLSNFRISNATLYSGASLTIPQLPLTSDANTRLLLLVNPASPFIDSSSFNVPLTFTNVTTGTEEIEV
jgi:hypothetical protein